MEQEDNLTTKDIVTRVGIVLSVPLVFSLLAFFYLYSLFLSPPDSSDTKVELVEIVPDMSFKQIAKELNSKGIIKSWWTLSALSRFGGKDKKIKAGEYELTRSMNTVDVYNKLVSGKVLLRKVTVVEGANISQVADEVEKAGLIKKEEFTSAAKDTKLLLMAGIPSESFEGYLFPETYNFSKPITAQQIIWKMLEEGDKRWPAAYTERADLLGYSRHEIITLASIIEKESGNKDEQPTISSVFHNRMKEGMKLQSDPTVIYGIPNFNGNLTKIDLETPSPYNTYYRQGLPVGPICNPGDTALKAALYPLDTAYFYFVANGKGGHVFAATLSEHNANVNRFQRGAIDIPMPSATKAPIKNTETSDAAKALMPEIP